MTAHPTRTGRVAHVAWTCHGPLGAPATPVLLLHGVTDSGECWPGVVAHLTAPGVTPRSVLTLDARGHGSSGLPDEPFSITGLVEEAAAVVREVLGRPVLVVGHSMGGLTAQGLAAHHPDLVVGLVLEDPAWVRDRPSTPSGAPGWLPGALREWAAVPEDELVARSRAEQPGWQDVEHRPWARSARRVDPRLADMPHRWSPDGAADWVEALADVRVPVTLLTGDPRRGALVVEDQVRRAAALLGEAPDGGLLTRIHVPGAGHNLRRDVPTVMVEAIDAALVRADGQG